MTRLTKKSPGKIYSAALSLLTLIACACVEVPDCVDGSPCEVGGNKTTYTLTTNVSPANSGTVNRNPDKTSYDAGEVVTLTASPSSGYTFSYWLNGSTTSTITVRMDATKSMTAVFIPEGTDPCAGNPTDNPNCSGYDPCAGLTTAAPGSACCSHISNFPGCNDRPPDSATITINIYPDTTAGTVSPNGGRYALGTQVTFTATPASGYKFSEWVGVGGGATGSANPVTVTVSNDALITAVFEELSTDPCNPFTQACCSTPAGANHSNCQTGGAKYCYWAPTATNASSCVGIGGQWDDIITEEHCMEEYGVVINDCDNLPPLYCHWGGDDGCYQISNPDWSSEHDAALTNLQYCGTYGIGISTDSTCSNVVDTREKWYCFWETDGCVKIDNLNAKDPNSTDGLTYLENCWTNGKLSRNSECSDTTSAVNYYCDWGIDACWDMQAGNQPCTLAGSCTGTQMDYCKADGARVVLCTGSDRPQDGKSCCEGITVW